jgi:hypothetical protein
MNKLKNSMMIAATCMLSTQVTTAQVRDTVMITAANLSYSGIKYGQAAYLVYNKKSKDSPAEGVYMVNINVALIEYKKQPAIEITQRWDGRDTIIHRAHTILNKADFSTRFHQISWKSLTYATTFDFDSRNVSFEGSIADSTKQKIVAAFDESFQNYNLNWHSDLFVFTRFPYKANRTFKIVFYDPGSGRPSEEIYSVIGSDVLHTNRGEKINCWIMERKGKAEGSYQKFWIDKKSKLVYKEEDLFNNRYRFKLKLAVTQNG